MEIRFAEKKDIPGILELLRQVGKVHHDGRPDLFRPDAQKYDADVPLSAACVSVTTLLSILTMPIIVGIAIMMK